MRERRHQKRRRGSKFEKLLLSVCRLSTTNTLGLNNCRRPWHVFTCSQQLQRRISRGLFTVQNEPLVPHCRCTFKRLINPYIHSVGFYMGWVMKRVFLMRHLFKTLILVWIVSDRPQWSSTETILLLSWSDLQAELNLKTLDWNISSCTKPTKYGKFKRTLWAITVVGWVEDDQPRSFLFQEKKHFKDSLLVFCHTHNHVFLPLSLPLRVYV